MFLHVLLNKNCPCIKEVDEVRLKSKPEDLLRPSAYKHKTLILGTFALILGRV